VSFSVHQDSKADVNDKTSIQDKAFKITLIQKDQEHNNIDKKIKGSNNSIRKSRKSKNLNIPSFEDEIQKFVSIGNEQKNLESRDDFNNIDNNLDRNKSRKSFLRNTLLVNNIDNKNPTENNTNSSLTPSPIQSKKSTGKIDENILVYIPLNSENNKRR